MKKLLIVTLLLNAALLAGRFWQEMPVNAQVGPEGPATDERFCADANGDGEVDLSDPITILNWLFTGGQPPYCIAQGMGLPQGLTPEQAEILSHMSVARLSDGQGGIVKTLRIRGLNVQIVNGLGATNGTTNGLGNLIVGYQELRGAGDDRTGSHNVIVGMRHNYSEFGGIVVGDSSTISGEFSSVTGGFRNSATGDNSSVSGGQDNIAGGTASTVSGGQANRAGPVPGEPILSIGTRGNFSSVSGGQENTAKGDFSSVSGGRLNIAGGPSTIGGGYSSVCGGNSNEARGSFALVSGGAGNVTSHTGACVNGGFGNTASGQNASVCGGEDNTADGTFSTVGGGGSNTASGVSSSVSGGRRNTASGEYSSVSGGGGRSGFQGNIAEGDYSTVSGGRGVTVQDEAGHAP